MLSVKIILLRTFTLQCCYSQNHSEIKFRIYFTTYQMPILLYCKIVISLKSNISQQINNENAGMKILQKKN